MARPAYDGKSLRASDQNRCEGTLVADRNFISAEMLRARLVYDPNTGLFKKRVYSKNNKRAGLVGSKHAKGYLETAIDGRKYLLHRLAWLYVHGVWPTHEIDHINRIKTDNRIANLRDVSHAVNMENTDPYSRPKTFGYVGRFRSGWRAQLRRNKVSFAKTCATEQEAKDWLGQLAANLD